MLKYNIFIIINSRYAEERFTVFHRSGGGLLWRNAFHLGDLLRYVAQIAGVVPAAAHRHGAEIRAVRLYEYALKRADLQYLYRTARVFIRYGAVKAEIPAAF